MPHASRSKARREPTIPLINIVFLMLVFFMVAGTLARPLDRTVNLVETKNLDGRAPADALVVHADGRVNFAGNDIASLALWVATLPETDREVVRILPDRDLPAVTLVELTQELRNAGAARVILMTERALP